MPLNKSVRFEFGKNWKHFLSVINDERIFEAEKSLKDMLQEKRLDGKTFLDIGCGSGLFSLAACRLGANVYSFDYDTNCVSCTKELKKRYETRNSNWKIFQGDVLDKRFLSSLGKFDIVYSWGVLHHTSDMWKALDNVIPLVAENGVLFISIYNHQVYWTGFNIRMKRAYVNSGIPGKFLIGGTFVTFQVLKGLIKDLLLFRNPAQRYHEKKKSRGMSMYHDWIDWVGGYPYETAMPEKIFHFYRDRGFSLRKLKTCGGGRGCNEFVFKKIKA